MMATSQKLTEHFLTCPVCFEVFKNPSTLACDHTFCGQCVVSYTKTRPDAISAGSLPCPTCKRLTNVPDPEGPIEEWPSQLKPGLLLVGLMDTVGPEAKDTTNCNLCHEGGETTSATAWCSVCDVSLCDACLKVHGRMPTTRHHVASDLSGEVKIKGRRKVMCQEHTNEAINLYCKDCKKTLCQSCCIVYHRQCDSVQTLESMMPEMKVFLEAKKETLKEKIQNEEELLESRKSHGSDVQKSKSSIQSQIRSTAQKAMDAIKKKEKKLMDELDEVTDKQMGQLKADIKTGDMAIQIYRQQSEFIEQALSSDSKLGMYELYKTCESGTVEPESARKTKSSIEFFQDMDQVDNAIDEIPLGEIQVINDYFFDSPVLDRTIDCRTEDDTISPSIYDIICMVVNGEDALIVTDWANTCVKSFFSSENKSCQSRLKLKSRPWHVVNIGDNKLAVTLPITSHIVTVTVSPAMSILSSMATSKQYWSLTSLNPTTLAAGSRSPPCVDILDRSGKVLQSFSPLYNGQEIIENPNFLCTTKKGNIIVSDDGTKSVVCLTPKGDVVFKYSPTGDRALEWPAGITSTDTGDILVVDGVGHKVILLRETGEFVKDILTSRNGLRHPWYLDYDGKGNIYVRHGYECIQMFTFK